MLIDTHAHLNFNSYKYDIDEVVRRSLKNNIWMINVGTDYKTSKKVVEIAEKYPEGVFSAIGLHPINLNTGLTKIRADKTEESNFEKEFDYERYKKLVRSKKVVAIGEIGLDYYYKPKNKTKMEFFKEKQKQVLIQQMNLAEELGLPIIFHCRFAHDDLIVTLQQYSNSNKTIRGVVHCFTGTLKEAEKYLEMGFYLGFNGIIFKLDLDEVIKKMPLDRVLLETDCPYLTPTLITGRNEPIYLKYIAEKIAKIKNVSFEKIAEVTTQNTKNLFKI